MTSQEIVIRLINEKLINGEEAYILINDLVQAELVASMKMLKEPELNQIPITWSTIPSYTTTVSGIATNSATSTYSSGSSQ